MADFERRLREELGRERDAFSPSADLPARIAHRTRQREQRRQAALGVSATLAAVAVVVVGLTAVRINEPAGRQVALESPPERHSEGTARLVPPPTPAQTTPTAQTTPPQTTPAQTTPAQTTPAQTTPPQTTPPAAYHPLDSDGDGIPNGSDECRTIPGPPSNKGCPPPTTTLPARPPNAVADAFTVKQGTTLTVKAPGILNNDTDPDGPRPTHAKEISQDFSTGSFNFIWGGSGSFSFQATGPAGVVCHFTYQALDATGLPSASVTVTITIN